MGATRPLKQSLSPARLKGLCAPSSPCSLPSAQGGRTAWGPAEHMGRSRRSFPPAPSPPRPRPVPAPAGPAPRARPATPVPAGPARPRLRLTGVKAAGEGKGRAGRAGPGRGGSAGSSPVCSRHGGPGMAPALPGLCGRPREDRPGQRPGRHTGNALPHAGAAVCTEPGGAGLCLRDEKLPRLSTAGAAARVEPREKGRACQALAGTQLVSVQGHALPA